MTRRTKEGKVSSLTTSSVVAHLAELFIHCFMIMYDGNFKVSAGVQIDCIHV